MPTIDDFTIRLLEKRDQSALISLHNSCRPDTPLTLFDLDILAKQNEGEPYAWFGIERGGTLVGASHYRHSSENMSARTFMVDLFVDPLWHNQGLEQDLFEHLEAEVGGLEPHELAVRLREDNRETYGFFSTRDFDERERRYTSRLHLGDLGADDLAALPTPPGALRLRSLADLNADNTTYRELYTLMIELLGDVPWRDSFEPWSFETWKARLLEAPTHLPDGLLIAFRGDAMVGLTQLYRTGTPGLLSTGLTGVRRSDRRQGVATALKAAALRYAHTHGYDTLVTTNHATNEAMLALNAKLGFVRDPAWLLLVKTVATPGARATTGAR
ncbi:MAG: GNAT family N-acetyltransferase [Trueperaceae bacterium]|nr:GNAT family N-acetyltransferase [Trueperaceae bacterium]